MLNVSEIVLSQFFTKHGNLKQNYNPGSKKKFIINKKTYQPFEIFNKSGLQELKSNFKIIFVFMLIICTNSSAFIF